MNTLQIIMIIILIVGLLISIFGIGKCYKGFKKEDLDAVSKSKPIITIGGLIFVAALILNIIILLIRTL